MTWHFLRCYCFSFAGIQVELVNLLDLHLLQSSNRKSDDEEDYTIDDERNHKDGDTADGAPPESSLLSQFFLRMYSKKLA